MRVVESNATIRWPVSGDGMLERIEEAARTCYKSEDKITEGSAAKLVTGILDREPAHESVIEHEFVSVRFVCDRGISHEIVRHRLASYSQESTRYCDYNKSRHGGEIQSVRPDIGGQSFLVWANHVDHAEGSYREMRDAGEPPEIARSVLPTALKTELVMTANVREWRHFFTLRTANAAHPQLRKITRPLLAEFRRRFPVLFDDVGAVNEVEAAQLDLWNALIGKLKKTRRVLGYGSDGFTEVLRALQAEIERAA